MPFPDQIFQGFRQFLCWKCCCCLRLKF